MAAQFTETNRAALRGLQAWTCRARTSLPVPDGPVMRTLASDLATRSAIVTTDSIAGSRTTMRGWSPATAAITAAINSGSGGRGIYSFAPALMARTAALASSVMPQATRVRCIRSAATLRAKAPTSSVTSIITRSAPWPLRSAVSASSTPAA